MRERCDLSVYLLTDTQLSGQRGVLEVVRGAIAGGATLVQLRDPEAKTGALVRLARELLTLLRPAGIPLIINDRVDVALAAHAHGVHVGQLDMTPADVRELVGPEMLVGLSVTSLAQLERAPLEHLDYLGVGPIFATATKKDASTPIGIDGLSAIVKRCALPVVAIGGLGIQHARDVVHAGARGVAVVSAICAAADPEAATRALRAAVADAHRT